MASLRSARGCGATLVLAALSTTACGTVERTVVSPPSFDPTTTVESPALADVADAESDTAPDDGATSDDDDATSDDTAAVAADDDGSCLVGSWIVTEAELDAWYDTLALNSGLGAEIDTVGEALVVFGATDFTYTGTFGVEIVFNGAEGTGSSTGTAAGTWAAIDGVVTTDGVQSDLSASVVLGDATIDGATIGNGFDTVNPVEAAPYSCDGPTLSFQAGPDETFRHTVTLVPA